MEERCPVRSGFIDLLTFCYVGAAAAVESEAGGEVEVKVDGEVEVGGEVEKVVEVEVELEVQRGYWFVWV